MLFDSPAYLLFLAAIWLIYWRLGHHRQNALLLAASYFFYGWWDWRFLALMVGSTALDFAIARIIAAAPSQESRKRWMIASLIVNFSILGFFKYSNFFLDSVTEVAHRMGWTDASIAILSVILPPGISFYTFQEVAYIVDVYHGKIEPSKSFPEYSLFISLFPHLIAGPIQRPSHLLPQVQRPRRWNDVQVFDGLMLILEGLFRKCVVADNCALIANAAFSGGLGGPNLPVLLLGMYAFAWQIYGDFSGYSNIARGSAQLLGFHFMVNFRQPYLATNLQDFWRRWHISLSSWLRDYLYIPLGGNRHGEAQTYRNLFVTMLLGGLWHGANWTFVIWGALHGAGLAVERLLKLSDREGSGSVATWTRRIVMFHVVGLTWVFFRAPSIGDALRMLSGLAVWEWRPEYFAAFQFLAIVAIPLLLMDVILEQTGDEYVLQAHEWRYRLGAGVALFVGVILFSANDASAFIYFQF